LKTELIEQFGNMLFEHFDLIPQPIGVVDLQGSFIFINKAFEREYGLKNELFQGKSIFDFALSDNHKLFAKSYFKKMVDKKINPGIIPAMGISWEYLKTGDDLLGFIFIVNKTNQNVLNPNHTEESLQDNPSGNLNQKLLRSNFELNYTKKLLELVLKNAKIGIWKYNFKTKVSQYDEVCSHIFGFDPSYPGTKIRWKERVVSEFQGYITNSIMAYTKGKAPEFDVQYKFKKLDGTIIWIREKGEIVETDEAGEPLLLLGSVRDITPQKDFEELLIKAKEDAEKASNLKSELISTVNHELRTPLTIILGMTETIMIQEKDKEKGQFLNQIYDSANRLLELINDILDLSKIESHSMFIQKKPLKLGFFIHDYFSGIKIQADAKNLQTVFIIETDVPSKIKTDKMKLMQILNNLFGNALKYTQKGVIGLRVSLSKKNIVFSIFDSGIGIPQKELPKIFDRFYQVDASNRRRYKGTGLGLSIVKNLIEIMGGTISVLSTEGKGSCFIFTLPID